MGQINIAGITDPTQIIQPPVGVVGIYVYNGQVMEVNSDGEITPLGGGGKQIAITVSNAEINNLNSTPKTLIPASGNGTVNSVLDVYVKTDFQNPYTTRPRLLISEGGVEETWACNAFDAGVGIERQKFIRDPASATQSTMGVNQPITLTTDGTNPAGGTGSMTIYLTWSIYDENTL